MIMNAFSEAKAEAIYKNDPMLTETVVNVSLLTFRELAFVLLRSLVLRLSSRV